MRILITGSDGFIGSYQRKFFFSGKKERLYSTLYIQNLGSLIEKVL